MTMMTGAPSAIQQENHRAKIIEEATRRHEAMKATARKFLDSAGGSPLSLSNLDKELLVHIVTEMGSRYKATDAERLELKRLVADAQSTRRQYAELVERHKELEDAHVMQSKLLQKMQKQQSKVDKYLETIKMQEQIIAKMEAFVESRVQQGKVTSPTADSILPTTPIPLAPPDWPEPPPQTVNYDNNSGDDHLDDEDVDSSEAKGEDDRRDANPEIVQQLNSRVQELEQQLATAAEEKQQLEQRIAEATAEQEKLKQEYDNATAATAHEKDKHEKFKKAAHQLMDLAKAEKSKSQQDKEQLAELEDRAKEAERLLEEEKVKVTQLEEKTRTLEQQGSQQESKIKELEEVLELEKSKNDGAIAAEKVRDLESESVGLKGRVRDLEAELEATKKRAAEAEAGQREAAAGTDALQRKTKELEIELASKNMRVSALDKQVKSSGMKYTKENTALKQKLMETEVELEQLREQYKNKRSSVFGARRASTQVRAGMDDDDDDDNGDAAAVAAAAVATTTAPRGVSPSGSAANAANALKQRSGSSGSETQENSGQMPS